MTNQRFICVVGHSIALFGFLAFVTMAVKAFVTHKALTVVVQRDIIPVVSHKINLLTANDFKPFETATIHNRDVFSLYQTMPCIKYCD